jgi:hypothetical protein
MKKGILIAAVVTPIIAAAAGVVIARVTSAKAENMNGHCEEPTVYVDMAEGVSMVTGGPEASAQCDGGSCTVAGAQQVEVNADGRVQCVNVNEGQSLSLTWRGDGVTVSVEDVAAR